MSQQIRAFRYMVGFECIGSDCEATCCADWSVPVDKGSYDKLKQAMVEADDGAAFERWVIPEPEDKQSADRHATLGLNEGGLCGLLDADGLCSVHRRFGEEFLPNGCGTFPRRLGRVGDRLELAGSLGCPEVARRALLREDATDLVAAAEAAIGQHTIRNSLRGGADAARRLDLLRDAMFRIVSASGLPIDSRLFWLGYFAQQVSETAGERGDPDALSKVIEPVLRPPVAAKLHAGLAAAPSSGALGIAVVHQLLSQLRGVDQHGHIGPLIDRVLESFGDVTTVDALWSAYEARRAALPLALLERVDTIVINYARNFTLSIWYASFPTLTSYVHSLVVRVAALRFLMLAHPNLSPAAAVDHFDVVAIDVSYRFSRGVDHSEHLRQAVARAAHQALPTLGHLAPMLRV